MRNKRPIDLALVLLGTALLSVALLPWLGCSQKSAEAAAAPSPAPATRPAPAPEANAPAGDGGFTVSGALIVEHQLDVLAQREGVIAELRAQVGAPVCAGGL